MILTNWNEYILHNDEKKDNKYFFKFKNDLGKVYSEDKLKELFRHKNVFICNLRIKELFNVW